ncbi:MAG TPA: PAS domain S-box protein [Deltaproteobacteria bacterium]|nr:PAS domain S-box protein [Deltaproteobacteria bacterium]HXK46949.1 PAS domain S-box protein [Deltaproteobacteria bacterium]
MTNNNDLFSQCFHLNPIPAAITTITESIIVDANDAFCELSGFSRGDLIGRTLREIGLWVDEAQRKSVMDEGVERGVVRNREVKFRHSSGEIHDCLFFTKIFDYEGRPHFLSMAIDISERKRAEDALGSAEARYRTMVENTLSGVAIFRVVGDCEDFEYLAFNRAAERIDGITKEEVIGRTLLEAFPGSRESGLYQALCRVWRTGEGEYLPIYYYQDERISGWRESFVYRLPTNELVEVYSDHTALIRMEADLSERSRELYTLIGNLPGMVYRCANDRDWTMEALSQGCLKLTGYSEEELLGNRKVSYGRIIHRDDRDMVFNEVHKALEQRDHYHIAYRINTAQKKVKWVWDHGTGVFSPEGELMFLEGFAFDITEHMRIQEELRLTEERFVRIFQASPDWVSITTMDGGIYIDVNDGYLKASGYSRDEVLGRSSLDIEVWEKQVDRKRLIKKIREQGMVRNEEVRFRTKSGDMRHVLWSAVPITLGEKECILGWGRDITEYKYLEDELLRTQKMEAVGRLAGTIAHDFNNYLAAIEGFCELALLKIGSAEAVTRNIGKIRDVKVTASSLIKQLLSFSRKQPAKPAPVDLNDVITGMKELLLPVMGAKIDLGISLAKEKCLVLADRSQLEQVIMNLSLNARDAMPKGGKFRLTTELVPIDEESAGMHVDLRPGDYVRLVVSDNGTGMSEETVSHVFDPYFTTKSLGKGSGLGLTIVYTIVKQSGGCIGLQSEPDKGSTFTIHLPEYKANG